MELESNPSFGSDFEIDATNRLKPIELMTGDEKSAVPSYIFLGQEVRKLLLESGNTEKTLPNFPENVDSVEDLFEKVHETVGERWNEGVLPHLKESLKSYQLPVEFTNDKILSHQLGYFEKLRTDNPEAWRSLVVLSSEEQLAEVTLFRHWVKTATEEQLEGLELTRDGLEIVSDLSAILGKYVDHGYLKQMELADRSGGSSVTFLNSDEYVDGTEYLYDISADNILTYSEVFPYEWPKIVSRLNYIAAKIDSKFEKGKLSENYVPLAEFIREISATYGSDETDPDVLYDRNDKLLESMSKAVGSGCPVIVIPQSAADVAGDAMKVDIELRLGIRTDETRVFDEKSGAYAEVVQMLNKRYNTATRKLELTHTLQPFAFGPNLTSRTRGENDVYTVFSHINAVQEVAITQELPLVRSLLPDETISDEKYGHLAVLETDLHENAHLVIDTDSTENEAVKRRIGTNEYSDMVEEIKAETVSMLILKEQYDDGLLPEEELRSHLIAKIGTNLDYIVNKSPHGDSRKYYYSGVAVLGTLLKSGGLEVAEGGQMKINDAVVCAEAISGLGTNILDLYSSENTTSDNIKVLAKEIIEYEKNRDVEKVIKSARGDIEISTLSS